VKRRNTDPLREPRTFAIRLRQKILSHIASACFALLSAAASTTAPANLDNRFGTNGQVIDALRNRIVGSSGTPRQADGKIVKTGTCGTSICLARFLPDGVLDDGFGTGGRVVTPVPGFAQHKYFVTQCGTSLPRGNSDEFVCSKSPQNLNRRIK
jgi:hypothetical protein